MLVALIIAGGIALFVGSFALVIVLCMAASYGDEMAEHARMSEVVDVLAGFGDEVGAVVIDFPEKPAA